MTFNRDRWLPFAVGLTLVGIVAGVALRPFVTRATMSTINADAEFETTAADIDDWFAARWRAADIQPAETAEDLVVFRRLSLALVGAVPSLEEIREFDADQGPDRLQRWTSRLIADSRFAEYFPGRLVDGLVNPLAAEVEARQRRGFTEWLGEQIQQGRPYDQTVRQMIADRGLWADQPATIFTLAEFRSGEQAPERLAARTARFFLGQRIDCAQCHDHPFATWTQPQFESLAAFYGETRITKLGIQDTRHEPLVIEDSRNQERRVVEPHAPFNEQWTPADGHDRERLAQWLTHSENRRFHRAIANRVWGLMFGRPLVTPVDDIPDPLPPGRSDDTRVLDLLGDDFAAHGYDLRRMILLIAATRPFRLASTHPQLDDPNAADRLEKLWAVFPLTPLKPVQIIRAMQQAAAIRALRAEDTALWATTTRRDRAGDFVEQYSSAGDSEEDEAAGTLPQAVQRLSGRFTRELSRATRWSAPGRIAFVGSSGAESIDNCYLACLSRRPTPEEQEYFLKQLGDAPAKQRARIVEDIYWTLFNSAEFCWNH